MIGIKCESKLGMNLLKKLLYFIAALSAGILLSMEAAIGGALGNYIGELEASLFVFAVGAIILFPSALLLKRKRFIEAFKLPKWELAGGFLGALYLVLLLISVNIIGVGVSMVSVIIGQIFTSIVIDHFGWLGVSRIKFDANRLTAMILLIFALYFII